MNSLAKIKEIFDGHTRRYHFYLRDFRTGHEFEFGTQGKFPICSCFKLAVLMAYFDTIKESSELTEIVEISPENFSPGGGVVNYFTSSVRFSYFQLAQMMITFSDGTATDILVEKAGRKSVNDYLKRYTKNSNIEKNLQEMVAGYNSALGKKLGEHQSRERANEAVFKELMESTDYTNGRDLADLALGTYKYGSDHKFSSQILEILKSKRSHVRTSMFLPPEVKFHGKTGSLGFGYYMNDCGVIEAQGELVGVFGYTTAGWKFAKDIDEVILGLLGLSLARHFIPTLKPNINYSDETEGLIRNE